VEEECSVPVNRGPVVGVDLGVKQLATLSDGTQEPNPRHLKQRLKKLQRLHRSVSRKRTGSRNRTKAICTLAVLYRTVAHQRANTWHHFTSRLAKTTSVVVIADLHVAGMLKNPQLAPAIGDVGFGAFRRQLSYKAARYGCQVLVADRWEPPAKTCSGCGWRDEQLTLAERTVRCHHPARPECRLVLDRDLNAAITLAKLAGSSPESENACGEESTGQSREALVKLSSQAGIRSRRKQEPNTFFPLGE